MAEKPSSKNVETASPERERVTGSTKGVSYRVNTSLFTELGSCQRDGNNWDGRLGLRVDGSALGARMEAKGTTTITKEANFSFDWESDPCLWFLRTSTISNNSSHETQNSPNLSVGSGDPFIDPATGESSGDDSFEAELASFEAELASFEAELAEANRIRDIAAMRADIWRRVSRKPGCLTTSKTDFKAFLKHKSELELVALGYNNESGMKGTPRAPEEIVQLYMVCSVF
ncbi:hypothetical protein T439DRAFT_333890 [Meredithblackwellia eburnea MCA 4105]